VVAGHSGQFTPGGYLSTVKHTALAALEPMHNLPIVSPTRYLVLPRPSFTASKFGGMAQQEIINTHFRFHLETLKPSSSAFDVRPE